MRRAPHRGEQIAALFVVFGAAIMFGPVIWFLGRWQEAVACDPRSARWLGEQLAAHPYLTVGVLLPGVALWGGLVMLILVSGTKRLAAGSKAVRGPASGALAVEPCPQDDRSPLEVPVDRVVASPEEAEAVLDYFNGFHNGFIKRLTLISHDYATGGHCS